MLYHPFFPTPPRLIELPSPDPAIILQSGPGLLFLSAQQRGQIFNQAQSNPLSLIPYARMQIRWPSLHYPAFT